MQLSLSKLKKNHSRKYVPKIIKYFKNQMLLYLQLNLSPTRIYFQPLKNHRDKNFVMISVLHSSVVITKVLFYYKNILLSNLGLSEP